MAGVCCYRPDASDARLAFHLREGAYDTDQLIGVVAALRQLLGSSWPVIVVWDTCPPITASRWEPGSPASTPGCRWSTCRPTRPISTRWRAYGPT